MSNTHFLIQRLIVEMASEEDDGLEVEGISACEVDAKSIAVRDREGTAAPQNARRYHRGESCGVDHVEL